MKGISAQSLENKLKVLKQERQSLARSHPKFYDIRTKWKEELDQRSKKGGKIGAGSSKARPSSSGNYRMWLDTSKVYENKID